MRAQAQTVDPSLSCRQKKFRVCRAGRYSDRKFLNRILPQRWGYGLDVLTQKVGSEQRWRSALDINYVHCGSEQVCLNSLLL